MTEIDRQTAHMSENEKWIWLAARCREVSEQSFAQFWGVSVERFREAAAAVPT